MESINAFEYSKLKLMSEEPSKVVSWIFVLIVLLFLFIIFSLFFRFNIFSSYIGYVDINNNYNLRVIIDDASFPINKNNKLYIDNKRIDYKIINIEKMNGYYELLIDCKLDNELLINNNIIKLRFQKYTTTFMKELLKRLKKGMV